MNTTSQHPRQSLRELARRLGFGRWIYRNVHRRSRRLRWMLQFGVTDAVRYVAGECAMRRAARHLPTIDADASQGFACTFMTGRNYWHQTLFCVRSLALHLDVPLRVTIFDDGTLSPRQTTSIRRVLRGVTFVTPAQIAARLDISLPRDRFPRLRTLRDSMPMMRKFVDLRAGHAGWQLYLDSDMLFRGRPEFLVNCQTRKTPCHMHDRVLAYVLDPKELQRRTGMLIPPAVNAGIVGLDDAAIDWARVEGWLALLPLESFDPQLLEQTLTAMLLGEQRAVCAPGGQYHILYDSKTPEPAGALLLHYIFHAKLRYFSRDWRPFAKVA